MVCSKNAYMQMQYLFKNYKVQYHIIMINISNKVKHEIISCIITDTSLSGYSIGDSNNPSRGLWYINEVVHIIVLQLKV